MRSSRSDCPKTLLLRRRTDGSLVILCVPCESSRKCVRCAQLRAKRLSGALRSLAERTALKVIFATVTFKPSLGVSTRNVKQWRHRIFESLRRRAASSRIPLNYVSVIEAHKSGKPHIHLLIAWTTVRAVRSVLRNAVKGSYCSARLVLDANVDAYLTKYVTKQSAALTSSREVARAAALSVARGLYELIAVKPPHMSVKEWLDTLNVYWYDFVEN